MTFWPPPFWISIGTVICVFFLISLWLREKAEQNALLPEEPGLYCPKCGDKHRPGFTVCADCGVEFVAGAPVPPENIEPHDELEYVDLVEVFQTKDRNEVIFVKSLLGGSGIKFVAQGEIQLSQQLGSPLFASNLIPIRFLVPADQAEDARALIKEFEAQNGQT